MAETTPPVLDPVLVEARMTEARLLTNLLEERCFALAVANADLRRACQAQMQEGARLNAEIDRLRAEIARLGAETADTLADGQTITH